MEAGDHPSVAQYIETKRKLPDLLKPTAAVIYNQVDPRVCQLAARWPAAQALGFRAEGEEGVAGKPRPSGGACAHKVRSSAERSSFWLYLPDRSRGDLDLPVRIPLLRANAVVNATAAAACGRVSYAYFDNLADADGWWFRPATRWAVESFPASHWAAHS